MTYKIKDNVDFDELLKHGYAYIEDENISNLIMYKKVENDYEICVGKKTRYIYSNDDKYIQELIDNGLAEQLQK